jgi:ferredoxin-NADP reductase
LNLHPIFARRSARGFETQVVRSRPLTPTAHSIEVEKPSGFSFQPTQFTFLKLETPDGNDVRPMSLATSPTRHHLEYAVRLSTSAFKRAFAALRPGDSVTVDGPLGHYILDTSRPAILVAGGIGITPLKGMIEYVVDCELPTPVRLVYSSRTLDEIVYRDELAALERRQPNVRVFHTLTGQAPESWNGRRGRIVRRDRLDLLSEAAEGLDLPIYYVCGTSGFVAACQQSLRSVGVPGADVRVEVFRGYGRGFEGTRK